MNRSAWQYYSTFYRGAYRALALSLGISCGQVMIVVSITLLVRWVFDTIIPARNLPRLLLAGAAMCGLNLANSGVTLWTQHRALAIVKVAIQRFREELLHRFYTFSRAYYTETDRSKLHATIVHDVGRLDTMSYALVAQFLPALAISLALSGVLLYLNWFLFLVMLSVAPLVFLVNRSMGSRVKERINAFRRSQKAFSKGMLFVLQMIDLTRIQAAESFEIERQRQHFEDMRVTSGAMVWLQSAYSVAHYAMITVAGLLILIVGGRAVMAGSMTIGALLSFYVGVGLLGNYLRTIWGVFPSIIVGNEALMTLFHLVRTDDTPPYAGRQRIALSGKVAFESVSFQYTDRPVLQNLSLTIQPQTTVALVGPNGAGKSTVLYLLLGFYRPQQGQLLADDHPFDDLDLGHFRRSIGVVTQDPVIFPGTVWENITYGYPDVSAQQVDRACELVTAAEFIHQLPDGYDTWVGDNGVLLSGGQRQRLALARALLRQPTLLILDEPTNHLDRAAVSQLMQTLKTLDPPPTILLISHDLEIVREAQSVYMLRNGQAVTQGQDDVLKVVGDR